MLVKGWASPDDPALADYWDKRRRRVRPPMDRTGLRLLQAQHGRCPLCRDLLLHADHEPQTPHEWERWLTTVRKAIRKQAITAGTDPRAPDEPSTLLLVHTHCRRRLNQRSDSSDLALLSASEPTGLA